MRAQRFMFVVASLLVAAGAFAQSQQPVVEAVKAQLVAAGTDISGACGALRITSEVARRTGTKLLHKAGGFRAVPQPDGTCLDGDNSSLPEGYATDYVIDLAHGAVGYDILGDGGGNNVAQWSGPESDPALVLRNINNWREPAFPPLATQAPPPPVVVPPVVVPPVVVPPVPPVVEPPAVDPVPSTDPTPPVVVPPIVTPPPASQPLTLKTILLYIVAGIAAIVFCAGGGCR